MALMPIGQGRVINKKDSVKYMRNWFIKYKKRLDKEKLTNLLMPNHKPEKQIFPSETSITRSGTYNPDTYKFRKQ